MCWICDSTAPICKAASAPNIDLYMMCGYCGDSYTDDEMCEDFPEIFGPQTSEAGTQTGLGLPDMEVAPHRAGPPKRSLDQGTTAPMQKSAPFACTVEH